jgi:hypothetical protein
MSPELTLRALCARNQVPYSDGERLLPIVRRALEAPDEARDRILALVEQNLRQRGTGVAGHARLALDTEQEILVAVARVLHGWSPSAPLLDLGGKLGGLSSKNPELP